MSRAVFDQEIRPYLVTVPIGVQGLGFDRLDIDRALDEYISRRGRAPAQQWSKEKWQKPQQVSASGRASGISTNVSEASEFEKALGRASKRKRSVT
jgi:hypothetical protein